MKCEQRKRHLEEGTGEGEDEWTEGEGRGRVSGGEG